MSVRALPLLAALLLAGCGDGGSSDDRDAGPSPVEPLVGVWDLGDARNGPAARAELLVIRPVDAAGESRAVVYALDERDNCYVTSAGIGRLVPDPAFRRDVFAQNLGAFDLGVLSLVGGELVIDYVDTFDLDGDGDRGEDARLVAPPVAITEADLESQRCGT